MQERVGVVSMHCLQLSLQYRFFLHPMTFSSGISSEYLASPSPPTQQFDSNSEFVFQVRALFDVRVSKDSHTLEVSQQKHS